MKNSLFNNKQDTILTSSKIFHQKELIAIILINSILALPKLGKRSLWLDESTSTYLSSLTFGRIIVETQLDVHPPLYYFFMSIWTNIFGIEEISIRFVSWIFGILLLIAIYYWTKLRIGNEVAILSTFLIAINPFFIQYQQEARMYTILPFFLFLSFIQLDLWIDDDINIKKLIAINLTNLTTLYTHNYALIGLFSIYAVVISTKIIDRSLMDLKNTTKKKFLMMYTITLILYLPWFISLLQQTSKQGVGGAIQSVTIMDGYRFAARMLFLVGPVRFMFVPIFLFGMIIIPFSIQVIKSPLLKGGDLKGLQIGLIAILNFLVPFLISYTKFPLGYSIYNHRFVLFSFIMFKIYLSWSIIYIKKLLKKYDSGTSEINKVSKVSSIVIISNFKRIFIITFLVILLVPTYITFNSDNFYNSNGDYRTAVKYVDSHSEKIIPVLIEVGFSIHAFSYYFNSTWDNNLIGLGYNTETVAVRLSDTEEHIDYRNFSFNSDIIGYIKQALETYQSIWYFMAHSRDLNFEVVNEMKDMGYYNQTIGEIEFEGILLYKFDIF